MRVALIDSDTILWVACYYNKDKRDTEAMLTDLDNFLESVLINVKADKYAGYLQGPIKSNRHNIFSDYKGKRPPPPDWLVENKPIVQEHLVSKWKFELVNGIEADDAVASAVEVLNRSPHVNGGRNQKYVPIVCSPDKDLKQIPGWNYNTKTKKLMEISEDEAVHQLCKQLLHGDVTDNIPNVRKGVGPATAEKMLMDEEAFRLGSPSRVLHEFMHEYGVFEGMTKFAQNVLKATLIRDKKFPVRLNDVPETIKQKYNDISVDISGIHNSPDSIPKGDDDGANSNLAIN